jgi:hypothetical protein
MKFRTGEFREILLSHENFILNQICMTATLLEDLCAPLSVPRHIFMRKKNGPNVLCEVRTEFIYVM